MPSTNRRKQSSEFLVHTRKSKTGEQREPVFLNARISVKRSMEETRENGSSNTNL